jgi:predicted helicase
VTLLEIERFADKKKISWIAICSDRKAKDINKNDFIELVQDIGIRVNTDPAEIKVWLKDKRVGKKVVFTTYQSAPQLTKAAKWIKFKFK